jgi:hypothetical protein
MSRCLLKNRPARRRPQSSGFPLDGDVGVLRDDAVTHDTRLERVQFMRRSGKSSTGTWELIALCAAPRRRNNGTMS